MDIYGAQKSVQKLLEYIQSLSDSESRMYKTTKNRLKDVASTCQEVIHTISRILEDEVLQNDTSEFSTITDPNVVCMLDTMQTELDQLRRFTSARSGMSNNAKSLQPSKLKISSNSRKKIVSYYGSVLSKVAQSNTTYPIISDCAKLIWNWFDARFFKSANINTGFRYNIRRIPSWICDIVIVYSKHIDNRTTANFITEFNSWCMSLCNSTNTCKFAVPYDIYQVDTNATASDMSLTAVVIWDMLLDMGLSTLCNLDPLNVSLSDEAIYALCGQLNPRLLDNYRNYKSDPTILLECGIATSIN